MRDAFWALYQDTKFKEAYYESYLSYARNIDVFLTCLCCATSAYCIAQWAIWATYPAAWGIVIGIAQVLSVIKPFLSYSKRMPCIKFCLRDLRQVVFDIDRAWNDLNLSTTTNNEFKEARDDYSRKVEAVKSKYLGEDDAPSRWFLSWSAMRKCRKFFGLHYGKQEWRKVS